MSQEYSTNLAKSLGIVPQYNMKPLPIGAIPDYASVNILTDLVENDTSIIYTVPTNKTFYLITLTNTVSNETEANQFYRVYAYDSNNDKLYRFMYLSLGANKSRVVNFQPTMPMPLNEGQYIKHRSEAQDLLVMTSIFGYEVG